MEPCMLANSPQLPLRLAEAVAVAQLLDEVFRLFNDPFAPTVRRYQRLGQLLCPRVLR